MSALGSASAEYRCFFTAGGAVTGTRLGGGAGVEAAGGFVVGAGGLGLQPRMEAAIAKERRTRVRRGQRIFTFITTFITRSLSWCGRA